MFLSVPTTFTVDPLSRQKLHSEQNTHKAGSKKVASLRAALDDGIKNGFSRSLLTTFYACFFYCNRHEKLEAISALIRIANLGFYEHSPLATAEDARNLERIIGGLRDHEKDLIQDFIAEDCRKPWARENMEWFKTFSVLLKERLEYTVDEKLSDVTSSFESESDIVSEAFSSASEPSPAAEEDIPSSAPAVIPPLEKIYEDIDNAADAKNVSADLLITLDQALDRAATAEDVPRDLLNRFYKAAGCVSTDKKTQMLCKFIDMVVLHRNMGMHPFQLDQRNLHMPGPTEKDVETIREICADLSPAQKEEIKAKYGAAFSSISALRPLLWAGALCQTQEPPGSPIYALDIYTRSRVFRLKEHTFFKSQDDLRHISAARSRRNPD